VIINNWYNIRLDIE